MKNKIIGLDVFDVMLVILVTLKVIGKIDISWLKVFIPFYLNIVFGILETIAQEHDGDSDYKKGFINGFIEGTKHQIISKELEEE